MQISLNKLLVERRPYPTSRLLHILSLAIPNVHTQNNTFCVGLVICNISCMLGHFGLYLCPIISAGLTTLDIGTNSTEQGRTYGTVRMKRNMTEIKVLTESSCILTLYFSSNAIFFALPSFICESHARSNGENINRQCNHDQRLCTRGFCEVNNSGILRKPRNYLLPTNLYRTAAV